jgi:hypothetical protein
MSRVPSNTEQYMAGMQASAQNLQGVRENWALKQQDLRAQQAMGLEREKMAQQGQQFRQGLQAEAENYRKLNESRERMQQVEGQQFDKRMAYDKEQARIDRLISVKLQTIQSDLMMNEQAIQALAPNDPRITELRNKRKQLSKDAREVNALAAATGAAMQLAGEKQTERYDEISSRLDAFKKGVDEQRKKADEAFLAGFGHAMSKDALKGGFMDEAVRATIGRDLAPGEGMESTIYKEVGPLAGFVVSGVAIQALLDQAAKFFGSTGDPAFAQARATEFVKNPAVMAVQVVNNAIDMNRDAFGLDPGEAKHAATVASDIVGKALLLSGLDPQTRTSGNASVEDLRKGIAEGVGKLRGLGMNDAQIAALTDGLETLSENRSELLNQFVDTGDRNQFEMLDKTLAGLASVADSIQSVVADDKFMRPVGGTLQDLSKFDLSEPLKRARMAIGAADDPEYAAFMQDLDRMTSLGMGEDVRKAVEDYLSRAEPGLESLRPEFYRERAAQLGRRGGELEDLAKSLAEEEQLAKERTIAEGRFSGLSEAQAQYDELSRLIGGR